MIAIAAASRAFRLRVAVLACVLLWGPSSADAGNYVAYVVQPGDTLTRIALQHYGRAEMADLLRALYRKSDADQLRAGRELAIPTANGFFLQPFGIEDRGTNVNFRPFRHGLTFDGYVGVVAREISGNRFVLINLTAKPRRVVFDSLREAAAHPELVGGPHPEVWNVRDMEGDGDLDVEGAFSADRAAARPPWVFRAAPDGYRFEGPAAQTTAISNTPPLAPLAQLDTQAIRRHAADAVHEKLPDVDLAAMEPGNIIYLANPATNQPPLVIADWLGREALALEKGATPDLDRKQVRKIRVKLAADGTVLGVEDLQSWLFRTGQRPE